MKCATQAKMYHYHVSNSRASKMVIIFW